MTSSSGPLRGVIAALLAAVTFGVTVPVVKSRLGHLDPWLVGTAKLAGVA